MEKITIYGETDSYLVCEKPAGIQSEKGGLPDIVCEQNGSKELFPVHRLYRPVSGGIVYAKTAAAAADISGQIARGETEKEYLAVLEGCPEEHEGTWFDLLFHDRTKNKTYVVDRKRAGVREARLSYRVVGTAACGEMQFSLVRFLLETGRTHQIRAQSASRGLPVVGDRRYGSKYREGGVALRTARLRFRDPDTGEPAEYSFPVPETGVWQYFKTDSP